MPRTRKPYPPEFPEQMVARVRPGRSPEELSREFEPSAQSISNWMAQIDRDGGKRDMPTCDNATLWQFDVGITKRVTVGLVHPSYQVQGTESLTS